MDGGVRHIKNPKGDIEKGSPGMRAGDVSLRDAPLPDKSAGVRRRDAGDHSLIARPAPGVQGPRRPNRGWALIVEVGNRVSNVRWDPQSAPADIHRLFRL